MSSRAAARAAAMRLGLTSLAAIELDESTASTTVVCFWSLAIRAWGRATPTSSEAERQQQQHGRHVTAPAGPARHQVGPERRVGGGARRTAAAAREHHVGHEAERHGDERDQQVRVGEGHVILRSQDEAAAAASSRAARPATTNVSSFCSLVELTRVPMWS